MIQNKKTNKGTVSVSVKLRKKDSQTAQERPRGARKRSKCHMTSDISASRTGSQEKEKTACTENGSINELFQTASNSFKKTKKAKKDSNSRKRENMKTTKSDRSDGTDTSRKIYQSPVSTCNSNKKPFDSSCISGASLLVKGSEMFKSDIRKQKREPVEKSTHEHKDVECSTDSSQVSKSSKYDTRKRKREPVDNLTNQCKDSTNIVQEAIHPLGGTQIHVQNSQIETRFENISSDKLMTNDYHPIKRFKK